jgi:hypothetical protein
MKNLPKEVSQAASYAVNPVGTPEPRLNLIVAIIYSLEIAPIQ